MLTLFIVAGVMAIFAVYGYRRGFWSTALALGVLLFAVLLITRAPDQLVKYFNALYVATVLLFKGGFGAIVSGDLNAAKELIGSVEKPFAGESARWALFIVLLGAVVVGILLSLLIKPQPSVWGLILGLFYGYVLSVNSIRIIVGGSTAELFPEAVASTQGPCNGLVGRTVCALTNPQSAAMCGTLVLIGVAALVIVAAISATKLGKKG